MDNKNAEKNNRNDKKVDVNNPAKKTDKVEFASDFEIDGDKKVKK